MTWTDVVGYRQTGGIACGNLDCDMAVNSKQAMSGWGKDMLATVL
jgi:hypothetical protein